MTPVAGRNPRVITVRWSTVVRAAVVVAVLAALGVGIVIGMIIGTRSTPTGQHPSATGPSTTPSHGPTTTAPPTTTPLTTSSTTAPSADAPAVAPCDASSGPQVRPTALALDCATKGVTVTGITWSVWGTTAGGQGTGTITVGLRTAPAVVVVFHDVNGIFQDVSVTPEGDAAIATSTTSPRSRGASGSSTTTTTPGGLGPVAASQPGSGWGSE